MKALLQRVRRASVWVEGEELARIDRGLVILLGVLRGDRVQDARKLARRCAEFRCFEDEDGRMNRSLLEVQGEVLLVSQFTLAADGRKGRRPSFDRAAPPEQAEPLVELFRETLEALGAPPGCGRFGAAMEVHLVNHGPATFLLEEPFTGPLETTQALA